MTTPRYLSPTNPMMPVPTGIIINYSRDPKRFPLTEYAEYVESPAAQGTYHVLDRDQPVRLINQAAYAWPPGDDAPKGNANEGSFTIEPFICQRFAYPFSIAEEAVEAAQKFGKWDPIVVDTDNALSQAMTARTLEALTILDDSSQYPAANTASATTLGGVKWDVATSLLPAIKKGVLGAAQAINLATNGSIQIKDLTMVVGVTAAIKMAGSPEITDYLKGSPYSLPFVEGKAGEANINAMWGLPSHIAGVKVVVENSMRVTTAPIVAGTAGTRAQIKDDDVAFLVTRKSPDGTYMGKSFASCQLYWYKYQLAVEARNDGEAGWNKRWEGRVVDYRKVVTPSLVSAYCITDILT